jgi:hypothetical protein
MSSRTVPVDVNDPLNCRILAVSEDQIAGFHIDPFHSIAQAAGLDVEVVIERIRAMLEAGVIRRVRQTLMAINLAPGALVAWKVPEEKLGSAFDWMFHNDPFSGHVVIRSTDAKSAGSDFRLWTTLKVPARYSLTRHADLLCRFTGAEQYRLMPAVRVFALGVGHMRRRNLQIGSKSEGLADAKETNVVELSDLDWQVLIPLKREFAPWEITERPWERRVQEAGVPLETFVAVAQSLSERGVIGRFSTFLEHSKPTHDGQQVTRHNGLFHWAVPPGREIDAGREIGRFHVMTHVYWRSGAEDFGKVNIMGVAHGMEKPLVLAHKAAIDEHLKSVGIPLRYTNVFWGERSEIKPSEISPQAYSAWCVAMGVDPNSMRA